MPRAARICAKPGCPKPVAKRYCVAHDAEYEAKRGNSSQRGYGSAHRKARANAAPEVATGRTACVRCGETIHPGQDWHLDHNDDRSGYLGPAHARCNTSAGGRKAHTQPLEG